jgi:hypothetical protein
VRILSGEALVQFELLSPLFNNDPARTGTLCRK